MPLFPTLADCLVVINWDMPFVGRHERTYGLMNSNGYAKVMTSGHVARAINLRISEGNMPRVMT